MKQNIWQEPAAHGVRHIEAEANAHSGAAYLTLKLSGLTHVLGRPTEGELEIFGPVEMAEKYQRLAKAITEIFGEKVEEKAEEEEEA